MPGFRKVLAFVAVVLAAICAISTTATAALVPRALGADDLNVQHMPLLRGARNLLKVTLFALFLATCVHKPIVHELPTEASEHGGHGGGKCGRVQFRDLLQAFCHVLEMREDERATVCFASLQRAF